MKKIEAIIKPFKLEEVKDALAELGIEGMTIVEVKWFGSRDDRLIDPVRGSEYALPFKPKIKIEVVVGEMVLESALDAIERAAGSKNGDRKIFVASVDEAVRIRTSETGERAL